MYIIWKFIICRAKPVATVETWEEAATLCNKYESPLPDGCTVMIETENGLKFSDGSSYESSD